MARNLYIIGPGLILSALVVVTVSLAVRILIIHLTPPVAKAMTMEETW